MSDPTFRVTTYQVPAGGFAGRTYLLNLRHELAPAYFTMVQWSVDTSSDVPAADVGVQVVADPYGTGDLAVADGNWLTLQRGSSTTASAAIQVTVVECLRDQDGGGFRLRDVLMTALPTTAGVPGVQTATDTSSAWTDSTKVVPFGGHRGGGIQAEPAASTPNHVQTLGVRLTVSGTGTLTVRRYDTSGAQVVAASCTTYLVEWGHEWSVDVVAVAGTNTGITLDAAGMYSTGALSAAVVRANSWLWSAGYTDGVGAGDSFLGVVATLGNGAAQSASETTVAVGNAQALGVRQVDAYVMQHAKLASSWVFSPAAAGAGTRALAVTGAAGDEQYLTTDAPLYIPATEGRLSHLQVSVPSALTSEIGQVLLTTRPTASAVVTATMQDPAPSLGWMGWLVVADFAAITVQSDALPTIRVTTYRVAAGMFTGTTFDIKLVRPLSANYYAMIVGSDSGAAAPSPADSWAWVAQDPYGTGDLGVSSGASTLRLARGGSANDWTGQVTVVECLRGDQHAGFRLVDVRAVAAGLFADSGVQVVNASANASWSALDRVVVFAGHRGGGVQPVGALTSSDVQGMGAMVVPTGSSGLQLARYSVNNTALKAATFICYVVEWGDEWQVQQLVVQAAAGGTDVNATGEYASFYLSSPVTTARTMVWAGLTAELEPAGSSWLSAAVVLGDGVTVGTVESRVSIGLWTADAYLGAVYVLSHPSLSVSWVNQATTASTALSEVVPQPVRSDGYWSKQPTTCGSRWGAAYTALSTASTPPDVPATMTLPRPLAPTNLRVLRDRAEGSWAGWLQAIDAGGIYTAVGTAGVALTDASALTPQQYLVLQDPLWDGAASVLRVTSQGGRAAGAMTPASANQGSVVGFLEGTPTTDAALTFRARGGPVGGSGGWLYRTDAETTAADWKAMNCLTTYWRQDSVSALFRFAGHDVAYSAVYRRLLVALVKSVSEIRVYYKDADAVAPGGWAYVSIVTGENADPAYPYCGLGVCELPDGTMLMSNLTQDSLGFFNITTYTSSDGGLTWSRLSARILNKAVGAAGSLGQCQGQIQMDGGGDWIRLSFLYDNSGGAGMPFSAMYTLVSPDRGASWSAIANLSVYSWKAPFGYPGSFPVAMVAVGDASGTHLVAYQSSVGSSTISVAVAARDDDWEYNSALDWDVSSYATAARVKGMVFVRTPDRIWLLAWVEGTDASEIVARVVSPANPADGATWTTMGALTGFGGVLRYGPHQVRGVWAGHRIVLSGGLHDPTVAAGADPVVAGHWLVQSGAYDPKPWDYTQLDTTHNDYFLSGYRLVSYQWQPCMGRTAPAGADTDANTPWVETIVAGGTSAYDSAAGTTFTGGVAADAAYHTLTVGVPAGYKDRWGAANANLGHCFHLRLQATSQRVDPASQEDMGVHVLALKDAGVNGYSYVLRVGTTRVVLHDNVAASTLMNVATTDLSSQCEVRITESADQVWIAWRKASAGPLAQWTENGPYTVTSGALAAQAIKVGVLAAVASGVNSILTWSDLAISYQSGVGQPGSIVKPDDMMGTRLNREAVLVANGLRVRWGGSGASDQDSFTGALDYLRGYQNLSMDSPRYYWESSSLVSQELVFQADDVNSGPRWQMNALLLVGTVDRTATLQFSATDSVAAWAAPAAQYDLDATTYDDLTVLSVDGSAVQVVAATGDSFAPRRGELVGQSLRFTVAGAATGITATIVNDLGDDGTGRWLLVDGGLGLQSLGVQPGAKACVYGDRMVHLGTEFNRYRYWRIVFPDVSTTYGGASLGTPTGTHRIGSMVPGFWHLIDPPLDWTTTDNEQPNVTEYRTKGGAGWQYTEGPAQRTFTGKAVGDVQEGRRALRDLLREHHGYSARPIGLVIDSTHHNRDTVVYGRWSAGGQLSDAAWYRDADGVWRTAGDTDLLVNEET